MNGYAFICLSFGFAFGLSGRLLDLVLLVYFQLYFNVLSISFTSLSPTDLSGIVLIILFNISYCDTC